MSYRIVGICSGGKGSHAKSCSAVVFQMFNFSFLCILRDYWTLLRFFVNWECGNRGLCVVISGSYKIKGVGDVLSGRIEQGVVGSGDEVLLLPRDSSGLACLVKVF